MQLRLILCFQIVFGCVLLPDSAMAGAGLSGNLSEDFSVSRPAERNAYFGELHIHSKNSFDAYISKVRVGPEQAYRYGMGLSISHFGGDQIHLKEPLDFMAVTDHAKYLGVLPGLDDPALGMFDITVAKELRSTDPKLRRQGFERFLYPARQKEPVVPPAFVEQQLQSAWQHTVALADQYYQPGKFTTFAAYEWTAVTNKQGLHRNVIFKGPVVPEKPFTSVGSTNPEKLWDWMDNQRARGSELLAIPHNGNLSNGLMFPSKKWDGSPIDEQWSRQRMLNEPLVEITQVKGTSETHPALSPSDEWAGFELLDELMGTNGKKGLVKGSYARDAYLTGIKFKEGSGFNPYQFGVIGSSDGHNASSPIDEDNYTGKSGKFDGTPELRRTGSSGIARHAYMLSASGLAGVWAEENTREAIFEALKRKETFATSGTRIRTRLFAGWQYSDDILTRDDWLKTAYRNGVPMGGTLPFQNNISSSPVFLAQAVKDPASNWLQRIQIVKGWITDGMAHEKVFDIACSDGLSPNPVTNRCPDNGAKVDLKTCDYSKNVGDAEIAVVWRDPEFKDNQRAFYYLRVLENPTCRWSTWEAIRNGWAFLEDVPTTIQERAWSSPIWYNP